jgi:hypothetical protein
MPSRRPWTMLILLTLFSRAMVTAIVSAGAPLGIASGALLVTSLMDAFGWRTSFLVLSLVSVGWSIAWFALQRGAIAERGPLNDKPRAPLAYHSTTAGVIVAAFCVYWVLALAVNWFPGVLQVISGLSPIGEAKALAPAWAPQVLVFSLAVRLTGSLRRRGCGSELVFVVPAACAVAISGIALALAGYVGRVWGAPMLIAVALWSTAVTITCLPPIIAEVTPAQSRGTALGLFAAPVALLLMKPTRHAIAGDREESAELAVFG